MKKTLSFIAVIFTLIIVLCVSAYATNKTINTAKLIQLNTTETIIFQTKDSDDAYDQFRWFTFTPTTTGCYKFQIDNPYYGDSENDTFVCLYDSLNSAKADKEIIYADMDSDKSKISFSAKLTANKKYYIFIEVCACLGIENPHTMQLSITNSHDYKNTKIKATTSKNGRITTACSICGKIIKTTIIYKASSVKLSTTKYTYNGKTKTPTVTVKDRKGKTLKLNTDYTVKYSSGRKNPGKYSVKITFKGNYTGTKTLTFTITPATPTLSVKSGAKKDVLKWNKQVGATGYVVYMSTSKNGKYSKIATAKGNSSINYTKTGLTNGKTYYFKVAAYTTVGGKNIYGSFSTVKSAKIK